MSDSDRSPQRDDRHHRRSRSRSRVSPGYPGETLAEREERQLAEAAVPVGPPAGQPRIPSADNGLSTRGPAPAEETAPAAQATSPAAPPPKGAPGTQGAATAAPASRTAAPTPAPRRAASAGAGPGAGPGRLAGSRRSRRGEQRGCTRSRDHGTGEPRHRPGRPRRGPQHAAGVGDRPSAGPERLAGGRRSHSGEQGGCQVPRPRQPQPHPHQPPQAVLPQGRLPYRADAERPPPGTRAYAARRHAAAAAAATRRPARDPGGGGQHAGGGGCWPRELGAGGRRRQGECPGTNAGGRPGCTRQGARAKARARYRGQRQRRGTERG